MGRRGRGRGGKKRGGGGGRPSSSMLDDNDSDSEFSVDSNEPLAFSIGDRVELFNLKDHPGDPPHTGTVVGHWKRRKHWPECFKAPYLVLLDDGLAVYCHRTDREFIRGSDVPPMVATFGVGRRVECQLEVDGNWFPGTVIQRHDDWAKSPLDTPPYLIQFDYGRERPFWGPEDRIRESKVKSKRAAKDSLRFRTGDKVECMVDEEWMSGIVVETWYHEENFANGHVVPYQVRLDTGDLIYAPTDDDVCIKKSTAPELPLRFAVGDRVLCSRNDGWLPGFVVETRYREEDFGGAVVPYKIQLDEGEIVFAPMDSDLYVKTPLRFKVGDKVVCCVGTGWASGTVVKTHVADDDGLEVPYRVQLDIGYSVFAPKDNDMCIKKSNTTPVCRGELNGFVRAMSKLLIHKEEYDGAANMLQEIITMTRSQIRDNALNEDDDDAARLKVDLASFLMHLADVHESTGSLVEMKEALDEAVDLIEFSRDKYRSQRMLHVTSKLAIHAALISDKHAALKYSEEAIIFMKEVSKHDSFRLGCMLFRCGKLNVGCNYRNRGMMQMSEGVKVLTRLYGCDHKDVQQAREEMHKIFQGELRHFLRWI